MEKGTLEYHGSSIGYLHFGHGNEVAICFHGYGESAESFVFFEKYAGDHIRFLAIDLPYHGRTAWDPGRTFTVTELAGIVDAILLKIDRDLKKDSLILLGFSLGGRMALSYFQQNPGLVKKIILLAPDGLKVNFWYWLATQSHAGNRLFRLTMLRPQWFFGFLKLLNRMGVVNASIFKFVNHYIADEAVRMELYDRWTGLRKIKPDLKMIRHLVKKYQTRIHLVYGSHDRIILSSVGNRFVKGLEKYCTLSVIRSGHQVLHEKHVEDLLPLLFTT
jgi:pimeloyl-ACP methyl ester carboxylesterase